MLKENENDSKFGKMHAYAAIELQAYTHGEVHVQTIQNVPEWPMKWCKVVSMKTGGIVYVQSVQSSYLILSDRMFNHMSYYGHKPQMFSS